MGNDPDRNTDETWKAIVEVHNESKALFLLCEELEPRQFRTFIQPYNELRHAYEHTVRCMANQLAMDGRTHDNDYQWKSMSKALGHEYRGFFDCADWLAVILRESIQNTLRPYSPACIIAALPDYYSRDRIRVLEISESIAQIRGDDKDIARKMDPGDESIAKEPSAVDEVRKYKGILSDLREIHKTILRAVPSLEDYRKKAKRDDIRKWILRIVGALVVAGIGGVVGSAWQSRKGKDERGTVVKTAPSNAAPDRDVKSDAGHSPSGAGAAPNPAKKGD